MGPTTNLSGPRCPANVEVLTLIDGIRAKIAPKRSWRGDLIGSVLARPALMRGLPTAAGLSQTRKIAKSLGFPAFAAAVRNTEPQPCNTPAQVVFSAGCANELVQPALADACLQIAHASKIPARIQQTCCGGYAKHRGQIKKASRLADEIATKQDPCCFEPSLFRANAAQSRGNLRALLGKIDGVEYVELAAYITCCGAGGSYRFDQAKRSAKLGGFMAEAIQALKPDLVLSANVGCLAQLRTHLQHNKDQSKSLDVVHPLVFTLSESR